MHEKSHHEGHEETRSRIRMIEIPNFVLFVSFVV